MPRSALRRSDTLAGLVALALVLVHSPAFGDTWGVKSEGGLSGPPSTLFRFAGGTYSAGPQVTLSGGGVDVDGLALGIGRPLLGFILSPSPQASQLVSIHTTTGVATPIGSPLLGRDVRGAAFRSDGRLLVLDAIANAVLEINPATGAVIGSPIGLTRAALPHDLSTLTDLVDTPDGMLLVDIDRFFHLDPGTGSLLELFVDTIAGLDGFTLGHVGLSWGVDLNGASRLGAFDVNANEDVFVYDLTATWARALVQGNVIPAYNSGRGDMASLPAGFLGADPGGDGLEFAIAARANPARRVEGAVITLPVEADVVVTLHDVTGRRIARIADARYGAGRHVLSTAGTNDAGSGLAPGVYLWRMHAGDRVVSARFVLLP